MTADRSICGARLTLRWTLLRAGTRRGLQDGSSGAWLTGMLDRVAGAAASPAPIATRLELRRASGLSRSGALHPRGRARASQSAILQYSQAVLSRCIGAPRLLVSGPAFMDWTRRQGRIAAAAALALAAALVLLSL